jgi:hypothetical protein
MGRTASIRVVLLLLLATGPLWCQGQDTQGANSDTHAGIALPDAPSFLTPDKTGIFRNFDSAVRTQATSAVPGELRATGFASAFSEKVAQKEPANIFEKYLSPAAVKRSRSYRPAVGGSFMNRATYAASSIVITRDETGKKRLNSSYLLAVLTSAAAHSANCQYCRRSVAQPFSDFGSTIGNDAGINLFHEFEPGIRDIVKSHEPRFIFKIEDRIRHR